MKTYILSLGGRFSAYSKILDVKAFLINKSWCLLGDGNVKETYIFLPNGQLVISRNGIIYKGQYQILQTGDMIIGASGKDYLVTPMSTCDKNLLCFKLDGSQQMSFFVDVNTPLARKLHTFSELKDHILSVHEEEIERIEAKERNEQKQLKLKFYESLELYKLSPYYRNKAIKLCIIWGIIWIGSTVIFALIDSLLNFFGYMVFPYFIFFLIVGIIKWFDNIDSYKQKSVPYNAEKYLKHNRFTEQQIVWLEELLPDHEE